MEITTAANWHALAADEVAAALGTDLTAGLTHEEAGRRLAEFGPNRFEPESRTPWWRLLAHQFADVLAMVLVAAAAVSGIALGEWVDAAVIAAIVVLNALLGFTQEFRAEAAMARLETMAAPDAAVLRSGATRMVPATEIVPGDVIALEAGSVVPADARLVESAHLEVDESMLTGESFAAAKDVAAVAVDVAIGDRRGMVHAGTTVATGRGRAVVTATGAGTEFGRIAAAMEVTEPATPLQVELDRVGKRLALVAAATAVLVFASGSVRGFPAETMFLTAVALAVAAIPEGLPTVVTITLAGGMQRMARRNAIVRRLPAVETLGAASVICTDKTGTLTRNEMAVQMVHVSGRAWSLPGLDHDRRVPRFLEVAALCNDAVEATGGWLGDATEVALIEAAVAAGLDPAAIRGAFPRHDEFAFDSGRKRMATVHRHADGWRVAVKGAPESVLERCSRVAGADGDVPLGESERARVLEAAQDLAAEGLRTLLLAEKTVDSPPVTVEDAESDLVLLALVGISDAIRPEAAPAVAEAQGAGITVVMVTGDHEVTARTVAESVGILPEGADDEALMSGSRLRTTTAADLAEAAPNVLVYSRIDPLDKVKIVEAWQRRGAVVAMTGDGVNDAPALRAADIGVAMGSGTDVAREASDMVLADDDFATIVAAVREGRTIFANLTRVVRFLVAGNLSEVLVMVIGFLAFGGLGETLLATQLLWVNLVTDGFPALALGVDPPEGDVMARPPERERDILGRKRWPDLLARGAILAGATLAALVVAHYGLDLEWPEVQTTVFTTLVLVQMAAAYAVRARGDRPNRSLALALVGSVVLHAAVVYTPAGAALFEVVPLGLTSVLLAVALSGLAYLSLVLLTRATR